MLLTKIKNIFCVPDTKFVSATNVARAGKRGNICVGNNVSATMCPRFPGPLGMNVPWYRGILVYNICLINISNSVFDEATNKSVLSIERS